MLMIDFIRTTAALGCIWSNTLGVDITPHFGRPFLKSNWDVEEGAFFQSGDPVSFVISEEAEYNENDEFRTKETTKATVGKDSQGNKIVNQYALIKSLGAGSYGKVKLCVDLVNEQFYAIKVCHKGILRRRRIGMSTALQDVVREIAIMKSLGHPNIVRLYEIINDSDHEKLYMVLDYMAGGHISCDAEPIEEEIARRYFADIVTGVDYLHKQRIIHRDIKPENLLISDEGAVKVSDFGVSHVFNGDDDNLSSSAGSPAFLAPELCTSGASASGRAVDIWACGITLYYMLLGKVPFMADNVVELYDAIRQDELFIPPNISAEPRNLLISLLEKNPKKRITMPALLVHPWIKNCVGRAFITQGELNKSP